MSNLLTKHIPLIKFLSEAPLRLPHPQNRHCRIVNRIKTAAQKIPNYTSAAVFSGNISAEENGYLMGMRIRVRISHRRDSTRDVLVRTRRANTPYIR
jgi:hypothetical protein